VLALTSGLTWVLEWPYRFALKDLESRIGRGEGCNVGSVWIACSIEIFGLHLWSERGGLADIKCDNEARGNLKVARGSFKIGRGPPQSVQMYNRQ
jgi:hypothetical protein